MHAEKDIAHDVPSATRGVHVLAPDPLKLQ